MTQIRAIVFDFDGLICETEEPLFRLWRQAYAEHGAELTLQDWEACVGTHGGFDPVAHLLGLAGGVDGGALHARVRRDYVREVSARTCCPGVVEWIDEATSRGLALGIASSSDAQWVHGHLRRLHLEHRFAAVRTRSTDLPAKPAPDLYLATLAALEAPAHQALAVEDSPNGVRAAKAAGMLCVAVPNPLTASMNFEHADLVIPSLDDVSLSQALSALRTV